MGKIYFIVFTSQRNKHTMRVTINSVIKVTFTDIWKTYTPFL